MPGMAISILPVRFSSWDVASVTMQGSSHNFKMSVGLTSCKPQRRNHRKEFRQMITMLQGAHIFSLECELAFMADRGM
jgi:hypothetical protein